MKRNVRYIDDLLSTLKKSKKYLNEAYVFEDDFNQEQDMYGENPYSGEEGYEEEPPYGDERGYGEERMPMHHGEHGGEGEGESEEEKAMHASDVIRHEPIIGKIRETAIDGLKKYSNDPTSALYEFFKKVFLESDKVLTDTGSSK